MIPVGFRFVPTDVDLICYLWEKVYDEGPQGIMKSIIVERDLYGRESPREIFNGTTATELYFFTVLKKKFDHGVRMDRTVGTKGTWTAQNNGKSEGGCKIPAIYDPVDNSEIGNRKNLSFTPKGEKAKMANGKKEGWVMHEYTLKIYPPDQDVLALCRISKQGRSDNSASSSSSGLVLEGLEKDYYDQAYEPKGKRTRTSLEAPTTMFNEGVGTTMTNFGGTSSLQQDHNQFSTSQPCLDNNVLRSWSYIPLTRSLETEKSHMADDNRSNIALTSRPTSAVVAPLDGGIRQEHDHKNNASQVDPQPFSNIEDSYMREQLSQISAYLLDDL